MGRPGPGAGGEPRDPALADFPERSPGTRRWTSADQLGPHLLDAPGRPVLLLESEAVSARRRFHRQEAHPVLSALRHRAAELGDEGDFHQVTTCAEAPGRHDEPVSACAPTTWSSRDHVLRRPGVQVLSGSVSSQPGVARWAAAAAARTPAPPTPPAAGPSSSATASG
ncbi:hypothetical protein [Geodermatophilus sp. SYSU D00698]